MMPIITANKAGTAMVDMRKARPRICSRYSRLAINKILRIGLASHGLDEDLFERGLDQLKSIDGRHRRGFMQQLLRIAVRMKLDFGMAGGIFELLNLRAFEECGVAFKLHDYAVALDRKSTRLNSSHL